MGWCVVTPLVEAFFHEVGVTSALDLAGWYSTEAEVRQSVRADWLERDIVSLLGAWQHAQRSSRSEVWGRAATVMDGDHGEGTAQALSARSAAHCIGSGHV